MLEFKKIKIETPENCNTVLGMAHFIKRKSVV